LIYTNSMHPKNAENKFWKHGSEWQIQKASIIIYGDTTDL
jgi:hypothetical protein